MKAELNQEAVDNEVFSKAVKVNAVALSAVKSFLEVSKVLGVHRSTIISWRNNISLTDYNKYNQTSVTSSFTPRSRRRSGMPTWLLS